MYPVINLAAITIIALCKPPVPVIALYTIVDSFFVNRKTNRGVQILMHHAAVLQLCSIDVPNKKNLLQDLVEIEKSTALIMASKHVKPLKPLALAVWTYQRCWYLPRLVERWKKAAHYNVGEEFSIKLIRNLGFLWTLEGFRVPKKFLKPCIFSIASLSATNPKVLSALVFYNDADWTHIHKLVPTLALQYVIKNVRLHKWIQN
jgi:hypothetical protein